MNTINAALQAARSYAIMNHVKTAARFQPNGKIFLVWRYDNNISKAYDWNCAPNVAIPFPGSSFIFLPVINWETLKIPSGYAVCDVRKEAERKPYFEPFYICYNSDGNIAVEETIQVALVDGTNFKPVSLDLNNDSLAAWWSTCMNNLSWKEWFDYSEDPNKINSLYEYQLSRFSNVARTLSDLETILNETRSGKNVDYGVDHFGGFFKTYTPFGYKSSITIDGKSMTSISEIGLFKTSDNWENLPLFLNNPSETKTKQRFVDDYTSGILAEDSNNIQTNLKNIETIFINPYTGRIIKPVE
jgi:hypothetical protein